MNNLINKIAVKSFYRVFDSMTEGWDEAEQCDAHWDAGEWSGPAWSDNWTDAVYAAQKIVAERFGISAQLLDCMVNEYEQENEYLFWKATKPSKAYFQQFANVNDPMWTDSEANR